MTPPTPSHTRPIIATTFNNHSGKWRRSESGGLPTISNSQKIPNIRNNEAIPNIDIVSQIWFGFLIHDVIVTQSDKNIIHEHRINEEFMKIEKFRDESHRLHDIWTRIPYNYATQTRDRMRSLTTTSTSHNFPTKRRLTLTIKLSEGF